MALRSPFSGIHLGCDSANILSLPLQFPRKNGGIIVLIFEGFETLMSVG